MIISMVISMSVEKNIPIPPTRKWAGKYNFHRLNEEGDSVYINIGRHITHSCIRQAAYQFSRNHGFKVVTRQEVDGVRVWRV